MVYLLTLEQFVLLDKYIFPCCVLRLFFSYLSIVYWNHFPIIGETRWNMKQTIKQLRNIRWQWGLTQQDCVYSNKHTCLTYCSFFGMHVPSKHWNATPGWHLSKTRHLGFCYEQPKGVHFWECCCALYHN